MSNSVEKLKDLLDIKRFVSSNEARALALSGELKPNTVVQGPLLLSHTRVKTLPENLTVEGNLHLEGVVIDLPPGLIVKRNLYATEELIELNDPQVSGRIVFEEPTYGGWVQMNYRRKVEQRRKLNLK